jgi:deazaflavin-dependent oxidoreductase (nitroreductase family)
VAKYQKPDRFTKSVFNPLVSFLMRFGLSLRGSRVLAVQGRKTGKWHTTPVNPLPYEGARYLVAPRGQTQWVRNIRVSGTGELRLGRKRETIRVEELPDDQKVDLLRAYLKFWAWEVGQFFGGVKADSPEEDLRRIAPDHPVFRITGTE